VRGPELRRPAPGVQGLVFGCHVGYPARNLSRRSDFSESAGLVRSEPGVSDISGQATKGERIWQDFLMRASEAEGQAAIAFSSRPGTSLLLAMKWITSLIFAAAVLFGGKVTATTNSCSLDKVSEVSQVSGVD